MYTVFPAIFSKFYVQNLFSLHSPIFCSTNQNMGKLTKEEETLLSSYSATSSTKGTIFFYFNALLISLAPLYLFYGVHQMEVYDSLAVFVLSAGGTAYLLQYACKNQKRLLKHQLVSENSRKSSILTHFSTKFLILISES